VYLLGYNKKKQIGVVMGYKIEVYKKASGVIPFDRWFEELRDAKIKSIVLGRLDRVSFGNFGDVKYLDEGVSELRINYGPGYRCILLSVG
jgi:putative addiction module killer protein